MRKIDIGRIPELGTSVGMQGSMTQKDTAGPICLGALVGLATLIASNIN